MRQAKPAMLTEVDMRASMSKSWAATARRLSASLFPDARAEALLQPEHIPSQHEPAHVYIRQ
jgi:hypothetical protein